MGAAYCWGICKLFVSIQNKGISYIKAPTVFCSTKKNIFLKIKIDCDAKKNIEFKNQTYQTLLT
jgi:hypothetical protein